MQRNFLTLNGSFSISKLNLLKNLLQQHNKYFNQYANFLYQSTIFNSLSNIMGSIGSGSAVVSAAGSASVYRPLKLMSGYGFTNVQSHEYKDCDIYVCTAYNSLAESTFLNILGAKHCAVKIEVKSDNPKFKQKNKLSEFWLEASRDQQSKQMIVSTSDRSSFKADPLQVTQFNFQLSQDKVITKVSKVLKHLESYIQKYKDYDPVTNNCFDIVAEVFIACGQPLSAEFVRDAKKKEIFGSLTFINNFQRLFGLQKYYADKQYVRQYILRRRSEGWIIEDDCKIISAPPTN